MQAGSAATREQAEAGEIARKAMARRSIDINIGCPVPQGRGQFAGSAPMREVQLR